MNAKRLQRLVRREVRLLCRQELIAPDVCDALLERYPHTAWHWLSLGRWLLMFGALSAAAGLWHVASAWIVPTLEMLAALLAVLIVLLFWGARKLSAMKLVWVCRSLELLGAFAIVGLTFTLGFIYSSGSGNWPALVLIDLLIVLPLGYLLHNVLLAVMSVVLFFVWFGGVTGYVSGWGAYFFGMNYPLRFLLAGLAMAAVGLLHWRSETGLLRSHPGFYKVWLSGGVFFCEMSLWLMSLFGNYGEIFSRHLESVAELLFFNLIWAAGNVVLLVAGARFNQRMLRGYAITFLAIQGYTLYFWHIAEHLGAVLATFVAGAVTLALVVHLERRRRGVAG